MARRYLESLLRARMLVLGGLGLLLVAGLAAVLGLPVEAVPDISPKQVLVSVVAPGLATEEVEKLITFPVEASMTGIPRMTDLRSVSRGGVSVVYVQFADDTDINLDRTRVNERIQQARATISVPGITVSMGPLATGMGEIMQFQIHGGGRSLMDLNRIMNWTVVPQMRLVPGVVDVNVNGGTEETYEIILDPARLIGAGLSAGDVYRAVDANNAASGGGWIAHHAEQQSVVGRGLVGSLADFGNIAVRTNADGSIVRLRDLGRVTTGARTRLGAVTRDGQGEIVIGVVMMESGASSNATLAAIQRALPGIRQALPAGVTLEPYYTRATLTGQTIATVRDNLIMGAVLVVGVLVVVIGSWQAALVIASVIPVALVCAMAGMRQFGISANLLSLGAIDFGMIVDGSLVVIEHVLSRREAEPDVEFAPLVISSVQQVMRPVGFAILVIVMVYLPILTLQGIEGHMFRPMAQTVIMALLASLAYCFICMPVLASVALGRMRPVGDTRLIALMRRPYTRMMAWGEAHPRILFGGTVAVLAISAGLATRLGGEFIPQLDEGALAVTTTRLPSASLDTVLTSVTKQEQILRRFPEVRSVISNTGTSAIPTDPMGVNETDSFIFLNPPSTWKTARTQAGLVAAMDDTLRRELPDALYSWSQPVQMRMDDLLSGVRTQIAVSIFGDDLMTLADLGDRVVTTMSGVRGAADVAAAGDGTVPLIVADIDRTQAASRNVAVQDILDTVEAIGGHIGSRPVIVDNAIISTQVRLDPRIAGSAAAIGALQVRRMDGQGSVMLSQVAHVREVDGPPRISRDRVRRRMVVQANVRGRDLASYVAEAQARVARDVNLPAGYTMQWDGQFRNLQSAMQRLEIVLPMALGLIFALLVVAFGAVPPALLVFVNLPVAATGGIVALTVRGMPFSISAGIGFIALFGVAILNGVVLVSAIAALRARGMVVAQAAFAAAQSRFRPVMATALVASLGFFPMAFSDSAGAEVERPLASVVIGGLVTSTLLTLLVLPSLYARIMRERVQD
ncbi:cobalt/zinc/cadmium resistance heavy metal efflux pump protein CzcA [Komagataeibacter oboediens DSM 11826]|uniref:CusA/CzcA family heavy metal efflux RND transporter n=1 Tax=Komagataeibacter oboediens TaxID=65958 RepID=A0A318QX69_9PROT|nr:CusA/CzcA family heavy metal efflux RND transporter [Komagataeibacter oboediens]PYD81952.1 CusA/CzcA family heavy metal efflux RND transporter [Komagataeibacter oboediens]GBR31854.1 cobalt/zinc/cadmium resistance heavy metal efflux pump protein CzcA [Komagataeibacter oboediens DSM 11826]